MLTPAAVAGSAALGRSAAAAARLRSASASAWLSPGSVTVGYLASAQLSWDLTAEYIRERKAFGKPIAAFQNSQFKMAEMRTQLDIIQCYVDQCVAAFNAGALTAVDAAKAKLVTSEIQVAAADLGVQLHGGAGYMDEYPISRQYTDARISPIYAGSSEVMKIIISRECLADDYTPFNTRNF